MGIIMIIWNRIKREPIGITALLGTIVLLTFFVFDRISNHSNLKVIVEPPSLAKLSSGSLGLLPSFTGDLLIANEGRKETFLRRPLEYIISIRSQIIKGETDLKASSGERLLYIPSKSDSNHFHFEISIDKFFSPLAPFTHDAHKHSTIVINGVPYTTISKDEITKALDVAIQYLEGVRSNNQSIKAALIVSTIDGQRAISNNLTINPQELIIELKERRQDVLNADPKELGLIRLNVYN